MTARYLGKCRDALSLGGILFSEGVVAASLVFWMVRMVFSKHGLETPGKVTMNNEEKASICSSLEGSLEALFAVRI